jgi:hypothetical protein
VTSEASTDQAPLVRPAPWTFGLSSSGMHASDRRPVSPPRPVDGSMTCAKITFSVDGDAGHGGLCVWVNRAALVAMMTLDHSVHDTIRYARRTLPDIVHRD